MPKLTIGIAAVLIALPGGTAALTPSLKYVTANAALGAPKPGERRVVFIGDSITQGWVTLGPAFFEDRSRIGRGIAGEMSAQMRARFAADVLALKPAVVHIMAGTNDIAGNGGAYDPAATRANIAGMAVAAKAAGARVILAAVPPAQDFPWARGLAPGPKIVALNAWAKREAAAKNYVFADYYAPLATADGGMWRDFSKDGVHPNAAGYREIAPIAEAALAAARRR